ncbi:MAG: excinuclease ABC subunit UvrC, partial [Pseudomonadota bacterium]|nr:excinuclease ABC subunit UvrC [Pseudomonadota bacterium]
MNDAPPFDPAGFLASVARQPGVYVFLDAAGKTLYVGKARNLKNRLASYFRRSGLSPKTRAMVARIAAVETHRTHTETEALLLENNLIKSRRPRYNVLLRDDKSYPYIRLTSEDEYPRLMVYRGRRTQPGRYFGPYPSAGSVKETLHLLHKIFQLRQCEEPFFRNRSRPCLQHQIRRCSAPCVGRIDREAYLEDVGQAVAFLEGRDHSLIAALGEKMEQASENLEFETAAVYRDRVAALQRVQERQYVAGESGDADVIAVAADRGAACFYVSVVRHGRNLGGRYHVQPNPLALGEPELLQAFLPQHYLGRPAPREMLLSGAIDGSELLQRTL